MTVSPSKICRGEGLMVTWVAPDSGLTVGSLPLMGAKYWIARAVEPGADRVGPDFVLAAFPRRGAGPVRNARMLVEKPDLVIAFPGGPGTADMVRRARAAGVEVVEILAAVAPMSQPDTVPTSSASFRTEIVALRGSLARVESPGAPPRARKRGLATGSCSLRLLDEEV